MKRILEKRRKRLRRKRHIRKKIRGTAERPRLSVFKSNKNVYVQAIDDDTGATLASASSVEAENKDLKANVESAAKLGELLGTRMKEKKIGRAVFDRNGYAYHGIVKALADGVRKTGIEL